MIDLEINGMSSERVPECCGTFEELIALVREEKSPDEVVSSAWWNGAPISERDLARVPHHETGTLRINTRQRHEYIQERLSTAERYVAQIADTFIQASHAFKTGHSGYGNTFLARGVDELLSFVAWYSTILDLEKDSSSGELGKSSKAFFAIVHDIQRTCERLVAAQVLESSFTIATELETKLQPTLERMRFCCRDTAAQIRV